MSHYQLVSFLENRYAFDWVKEEYIKKISDALSTNYDCPSIEIERVDIKKKYSAGVVDVNGDYTTFGKLFQKLKDKDFQYLRCQTSTNQAWRANFVNEGMDDTGSFRKSISAIEDELHSSILPLLIPSINNVNQCGEYQDRWVLNPSYLSPLHLQMYKFIGALIGMAFRSGNVINWKFSPLFWKTLAGEPLLLDDLATIDRAANSLRTLREHWEKRSGHTEIQKLTFSTVLSDGQTINMIPEGDEEIVKDSDIKKYIDLVLKARFKESYKQINAVIQGFKIIFPTEVMRILTWEEIEKRVRGMEFDLDFIIHNIEKLILKIMSL